MTFHLITPEAVPRFCLKKLKTSCNKETAVSLKKVEVRPCNWVFIGQFSVHAQAISSAHCVELYYQQAVMFGIKPNIIDM